MSYTTTQINRDFRIKVFGEYEGRKINTLRGVSGIVEMIGEELFEKFLNRAYKSGMDATYCKLRRGLMVTLYVK